MQPRNGLVDLAAVRELVIGELAAVLRMSRDRLSGDRPFQSLGLDSLMGLELRNRIERALGLKLSASTVWNYPTANQLCTYLAAQVESSAACPARTKVQAEPAQSAARALEDEMLSASAMLADL